MVVVSDPSAYKLKGFRASKSKDKKIDAILVNKQTKRVKVVPFGLKGSETYKNTTGVNVDTTHNDPERRKRYLQRHKHTMDKKFSSSYFAARYLW